LKIENAGLLDGDTLVKGGEEVLSRRGEVFRGGVARPRSGGCQNVGDEVRVAEGADPLSKLLIIFRGFQILFKNFTFFRVFAVFRLTSVSGVV
jgi:hypothetical protein